LNDVSNRREADVLDRAAGVVVGEAVTTRRNADTSGTNIRYRIDVNLGDVLIERDDIVGDGVNIAARLEGICRPGALNISGSALVDAHFVELTVS
jgi:adenylate cyclase